MIIEKINCPADVKTLSGDQLETLAGELRQGVLNRVSKGGGHVGPNLGVVELTVALARVFDFPADKIVFDVSHQIYPYKMLTGRAHGFTDEARFGEVSGYASPLEAPEFDTFQVGHTSTSVALAAGLQKARDMRGGKENIIALIGDGSLSGGEAFEGFDVAAEAGSKIIIIVNDNDISIAENHGGLYANLKLLRETSGKAECNFFKAMGYDYYFVPDGNNIGALVEAFEKVKVVNCPAVVHVCTEKGHGYAPAASRKEEFHYCAPFSLDTGRPLSAGGENFSDLLGKYLVNRAASDPKTVVVIAGIPGAMGLNHEMRQALGSQYIDVGIAEECAAAVSSGLAKGGMRPVWSVFGTFIQRAYDQIAQDICINGNAAVINVAGCSAFGMNDVTHACLADIPMLSHIPGLVYLAPATWEEFIAMENWALDQNAQPVAIRMPVAVVHADKPCDSDFSRLNTYKTMHRGSRVAIIALGNFYQKGESVAALLAKEKIDATLVNPRFITGVDEDLLNSLTADHELVVTLEDGFIDGGFGERIARHFAATSMRVLCKGIAKGLYDRFNANELLAANRLLDEQIAADILAILQRK
ncbi:MAG: 1-deoxy-D-xylulose-5-phosphate synthase [Prevotella sp.]|nr:1-deoxy-D-xylulose-5-phosphate synthase [Prevotella sp.]